MTGTRTHFGSLIRPLGICIVVAAALSTSVRSSYAVIVFTDGFGDADRNNDGSITVDTDINDSGGHNVFTGTPPNATGDDAELANRNITEVTAPTNVNDVGLVWTSIRSFDTTANLIKSKLKIINDNVATGVEGSGDVHNDGLALGVESRGGSSEFIGKFPQPVALGTTPGDKIVVSVDWRVWREAGNNLTQPSPNTNSLRWGIYQDTDSEFGQTGPLGFGWAGPPTGNGQTVMWGRDDGKFWDASPGAEGDKGINTELTFGALAVGTAARLRWENNTAGLGGDVGELLQGNADSPTVATPTGGGDGPGGIITDLSSYAPHTLKLELMRHASGLIEVATFVDETEFLRDDIKPTDTNYDLLAPLPFTFNYVAFRNSPDFDYVLDNFKLETFSAGVQGDYNNDGSVNAADYVLWRKGTGVLANEVADPGAFSAADYSEWRARFGNPAGSGSSLAGGAVPEPGTISGLILGAITVLGLRRRRFA